MTTRRDEMKGNRENTGKWAWALSIVVISLAAFAWFVGGRSGDLPTVPEASVSEQQGHNRIREKIEREAATILRETDQKNRNAYDIAITELDKVTESFDQAEEGIEPAVAELASFKGCAILCYHMVKDKISGTCETEGRIQSVMDGHIGQHVLHANEQRENALARFNDALACNATDMRVRLAAMAETVLASEGEAAQAAFRDFVGRLNTGSERFNQIALKTVGSGIGLVISALLVKTTVDQAIRVLGHIARRMGTTTALAIGSAAADGPFPIGDAIALVLEVGGTAWCAYDLYHAQITLSNQVKADLQSVLAQYRGEVLDLGKKEALALLKAYQDKNRTFAQELTNQLS